MELRIDKLLVKLFRDQSDMLQKIHQDPLLRSRGAVSPFGEMLYLVGASKDLFTPLVAFKATVLARI